MSSAPQVSLPVSPNRDFAGPSRNTTSPIGDNILMGRNNLSPLAEESQPALTGESGPSEAVHDGPPEADSPSVAPGPSEAVSHHEEGPSEAAPPVPKPNTHLMQTRRKNNISKPNVKYGLAVTQQSTNEYIPTTAIQAMPYRHWRLAMCDEINSLTRTGTYSLVPRRPKQNIVGSKWVFTIKRLPNGTIDRYKARFVAKGFHQQQGLDYDETFSPVVKSTTIRVVLHVAVTRSWPIRQLDVNNAFLQGTLSEEVYVEQPPGFIDQDHPNHVCRLHKALYGLKQAPRAWYQELRSHLLHLGFTNSAADTSLFIMITPQCTLYVLVYVDDIIVTGSNDKSVNDIIARLADRFSLKDLGTINYFLGIEATRTKHGLHLMQRKYITDLLVKTKMNDSKPVSTPMSPHPKLTLTTGSALPCPTEYRTVIGSLQYLALTRPDIAYAVNRLSQFMHKPTDAHWQAAKRVLRYLAGTLSHGILIRASTPMHLHAFSDVDWAGDRDDYVSTNAYVIYLGHNPISWSAKKQRGVARSSTEAEYRAVANTASELCWLRSLLTELGISLPIPPVVYCDNIGATYLSANPVFHSRMKHIALDYHFIRDKVQAGILRVSHVSTKDQLADGLTKPLARQRFLDLQCKIGVKKLPPS